MDKKLAVLREVAKRKGQEFTVASVVEGSQVNPQTVRTVLLRHSRLLKEHGVTETKTRGGQEKRYSLDSFAQAEIEHLILEIENKIGATLPEETVASDCLASVSDVLFRTIAKTENFGRRTHLLDLAGTDLSTARMEIDAADARKEETRVLNAVWEELYAFWSVLRIGRLSDALTSIAIKEIESLDASRKGPQKSVAEFTDKFKRLIRPEYQEAVKSSVLASMRTNIDWLLLDNRNVLLFGVSESLYYPAVLRKLNRNQGYSNPKLQLLVNIPEFLVQAHQTRNPSFLESALLQEIAAVPAAMMMYA